VYKRILNWKMFAQRFAKRLRCSSRDILGALLSYIPEHLRSIAQMHFTTALQAFRKSSLNILVKRDAATHAAVEKTIAE